MKKIFLFLFAFLLLNGVVYASDYNRDFDFLEAWETNYIKPGETIIINVCKKGEPNSKCPITTNPEHYLDEEQKAEFIDIYTHYWPLGGTNYESDTWDYGIVVKNLQKEDGTYYTVLESTVDNWSLEEESTITYKDKGCRFFVKRFDGNFIWDEKNQHFYPATAEEVEESPYGFTGFYLLSRSTGTYELSIQVHGTQYSGWRGMFMWDMQLDEDHLTDDVWLAEKILESRKNEDIWVNDDLGVCFAFYQDEEKVSVCDSDKYINLSRFDEAIKSGGLPKVVFKPLLIYEDGKLRIPDEGEEPNALVMAYFREDWSTEYPGDGWLKTAAMSVFKYDPDSPWPLYAEKKYAYEYRVPLTLVEDMAIKYIYFDNNSEETLPPVVEPNPPIEEPVTPPVDNPTEDNPENPPVDNPVEKPENPPVDNPTEDNPEKPPVDNPAEKPTTPPEDNKEEEKTPVEKIDYKTDNVEVKGFEGDLTIFAAPSTEEEKNKIAEDLKHLDNFEIAESYDISFKKGGASVKEFDDYIEVKLSIPAKYKEGYDLYVFREHDGVLEQLEFEIINGSVVVKSNKFSTFTIVAKKKESGNSGNNSNNSNNNENSNYDSSNDTNNNSNVTTPASRRPVVNTSVRKY